MIKHSIESVHKIALKYETRSEFAINSPNEYDTACKRLNCLDFVCSHMVQKKFSWTVESIHERALKYTNRTEFRLNEQGAYDAACKKFKCLDLVCSHMPKVKLKYTIEDCHKEALKYNGRLEFQNKSPNIYRIAWKYKWLDIVCQHMSTKINQLEFPRIIYSYEFPDNSVYVGLTKDFKLREKSRKNNINDAVTKHINKTNLIPKILYLTDFIPAKEAQIKEQEFINEYKNKGWNILNRVKGGSIGGGIYIKSKFKL